jgi:hypothetical protein
VSSTAHAKGICTGGGSHSDGVWIIFRTTLDSIARRKEGIEALNESGMTIEEI